jgi:AcrR family transcriptional regulator
LDVDPDRLEPEEDEPRRTQRQAQADARREMLLQAALKLFAAQGVRGSTVRHIAREAGVTEGVIYHYFPGKAALVQAVVARFHPGPHILALIEAQQDAPAEEAFFRIGIGYLRELSKNREFVLMMLREAPQDADVAAVFGSYLRQVIQAATTMVQARIDRGELRPHDPTSSFRTLIGSLLSYFLLQSVIQSPVLPGRPTDPETLVRGVVDVVLHGVAVDPAER